MLINKFNKLGGTEIRTKFQVDFYLKLYEWIKTKQEQEKKNLSIKEWDIEYKKWTKKEEIYKYDNDKKIKNRFNFIKNSLEKLGVNYCKGKFIILPKFNANIIFNNLMVYKNNNGVYPFKEMIDFVIANPTKNKVEKIILSFQVFDGKETFASLYEQNIIKNLVESMSSTQISQFRKPPKSKKYIDIIFSKKQENRNIETTDMIGYDSIKQKKYIKPIVFKKNERFNLSTMIERLNKITFKEFVYKMNYNKLSQILKKEYFDLFSRWLYDFGLIDTSGKNPRIFYNNKIWKKNNQYFFEEKKINKYPWKFEEVIEYISKIAMNDFTFKVKNDYLKYTANSTIAEYFVNLYYSYKLNIKPKNFCKFANTKVNNQLMPIFTAPGNIPDMSYSNESMLVNIETTILKTQRQIENNEIFPCTKHYKTIVANSKVDAGYLIFVSPINPKLIEENFNLVFKNKNLNSSLIICTFNNLIIPF